MTRQDMFECFEKKHPFELHGVEYVVHSIAKDRIYINQLCPDPHYVMNADLHKCVKTKSEVK